MTQDTRKDRRVKIVSLNVRYKSATVDEFIENHAHDVSRGGIFIKTANPFPSGTLLKFEIRLSSDQAVIAGVGRIVWKRDAGSSNGDRPAGMGVKFIKIDDPSKVVIDRLVNTRADAGKAYESEEQMTKPSEPPLHTPPPGRSQVPRASGAPSMPSPAAGARSISPALGTGMPSKAPEQKLMSTPAGTPLARKATMIGLGASSAPSSMSSAPPASTSVSPPASQSVPPRQGLLGSSPSVPPRPGAGASASMFPKNDRQDDTAPKQEQTVMKQAAELLEEALREAGGSMEEVGTNPLFSATSGTPGADPSSHETTTPESEWTTADTPQALAATVAARRAAEEAAAQEQAAKRREASRLSGQTQPSVRAASPAAHSHEGAGGKKKVLAIVGIAAAALLIGGVMLRDQLFPGAAAPDAVVAPVAPPSPEPPSPSANDQPTVAAPPVLATAPPTQTSATSASAQTTAALAPSASAGAARTPSPSSASAAAANAPAPMAPRTPRPATRTSPAENGIPSPAPAGTSLAAGSAEAPSATPSSPKTAAPAPKPKPAKAPADDNPY